MTQKKSGAQELLTLQGPRGVVCTCIFAADDQGCCPVFDVAQELAR
jgi:hypothetical protein